MTNPKIRLVLSGLPLANPYVGQGTYTLRLIIGLQRRLTDDLVIVVPRGVDTFEQAIKARILQLPHRFLPNHELAKQILVSAQLLRFVTREYPDSVFHSPGPIAGSTKPCRTVVTIHDCIYRSFPYYLGRFFIRRLYVRATERFARDASLVLTDSEFSKSDLAARVGISPDRMEVLYPWVGEEFLGSVSDSAVSNVRQRLNLPGLFWLYLGGYDYRKNVELLVRAYAKIASSKLVPPLVLAGAVPVQRSRVLCDVLGTLKQSQLNQSKVLMPGVIAACDLPALYKAASLLIYPSLMEGFGLPPAEAMAVRTPILSSNTSSLPEVVQNSDCLFDPRDPDSLAEKLEQASKDVGQFVSPLSERFTEIFGIQRYLDLIGHLSHREADG